MPLHLHLFRPFQDRVWGELGAIVADDRAELSRPFDQGLHSPDNVSAGD